jgi:uncharacterized protein (TIGR01777 family)
MRVAIAGASGLIGSALRTFLLGRGDSVVRLVRRRAAAEDEAEWHPEEAVVDSSRLKRVDAVLNLAGENIAQRWTEAAKKRILESRVVTTKVLAEAMIRMHQRPAVFASASAIGYYGDRGDELLDEESSPGVGFLPTLVSQWEGAAGAAAEAGVRVLALRLAAVLTPSGGILDRLLPMFRRGLGGRLGGGKQYMSWIAADDLVRAIHHALVTDELRGPVNCASPNPVTNAEFTRTLARVLRVPAVLPAPAFALRLAFGRMADEALLASARVQPSRLLATGFRFGQPELEGALRSVLSR